MSLLGSPKIFLGFGEGDGGFFGSEIFAAGESPDEFGIALEADGEGDELGFELLFFVGFAVGAIADFDDAFEDFAIDDDFDGGGIFLRDRHDRDSAFAETFFELALDFLDGLFLEVRHLGAAAEFLETFDADLGGNFFLAGGINFIDELLISDGFGQDVFEESEELTFRICFLLLCHSDFN